MNWTKGFTYIFEDKKWLNKMFVGSFVTSVPVVEAITSGYQLQVIENLKAGSREPLPEWRNMDKMFGRGFKFWLAVNLFYVPSIIISVISWFLGIPLLIGLIASFIASSASDDYYHAKGISFVISYVIFPVLELVIAGTAVFLGSIALPAVFFFVPAMALRCQETGSLASTLNIFAHFKFVMKNLGDYIVSRVCVLVMLLGMEIIASMVGGATVWILGIGVLIGWFLIAAGRFWSRLAWAYFLVNMRMKEKAPNAVYLINQPVQNQPPGAYYQPANELTRAAERQHYWENY